MVNYTELALCGIIFVLVLMFFGYKLKIGNKSVILKKDIEQQKEKVNELQVGLQAETKELLKEQKKRVRLEEKVKNLEEKTEKSLKQYAERAAEFIITTKEELDRRNKNYYEHIKKLKEKACPSCLKEFEKFFVK